MTPCGAAAAAGSYGITIDPNFDARRLPLLDRGVVYAIAHIRGGGEMGQWWYEDEGKYEAKANTFVDFVACAEHLVASGWASPGKIAIEGRSAGGPSRGAPGKPCLPRLALCRPRTPNATGQARAHAIAAVGALLKRAAREPTAGGRRGPGLLLPKTPLLSQACSWALCSTCGPGSSAWRTRACPLGHDSPRPSGAARHVDGRVLKLRTPAKSERGVWSSLVAKYHGICSPVQIASTSSCFGFPFRVGKRSCIPQIAIRAQACPSWTL